MYKAQIEFTAYLEDYKNGQLEQVNNWQQEIVAKSQTELKEMVLGATYSNWEKLDDDQINEYDLCTEYHASYLANEENQGDASKTEIELWKADKLKLYSIECHILISEITETKASL